jgi:hypothetical protein
VNHFPSIKVIDKCGTLSADLCKVYINQLWICYRSWIVLVYNTRQTQTNERFTRTIRKRTIHEANARYTKWTHDTRTDERNETNELYGKRKRTNVRYTKTRNDARNERMIHEQTNHWSVAIYYPMTNDPGSIDVQYSIVLLFEWLLCKLMWLTNLIFYAQLIYINDKLVSKVIE